VKVVDNLDNPKHRNDLWVDDDGFIWYFDYREFDWRTLGHMGPRAGYANERTHECDGWPNGPYKRLLKGRRK
jgi:hypothetical protein